MSSEITSEVTKFGNFGCQLLVNLRAYSVCIAEVMLLVVHQLNGNVQAVKLPQA